MSLSFLVAPFRACAAAESGLLSRRHVLALTLFGSLVWLVVLGRLRDLLRAMHLPGAGAFDVNSLTSSPRVQHAAAAVGTWLDQAVTTPARFTGPLRIAALYLAVDAVFVLTYAILLGVLLARCERLLDGFVAPRGSYPWAYRRLATIALYAVPALALVDLLEDLAQGAIVLDCRHRGSTSLCGGWAAAATPVGFGLTVAKWLLVAEVLVSLLLAGGLVVVRRLRDPELAAGRRASELWRVVVLLRVQVLAVVVWAFALLGPVAAGQAADVIRRWSGGSDVSDGVIAIAAAGWLAALIVGVSDWLVVAARPATLRPVSLWPIALAAAAALGLGLLFQLTFDGGLGLLALGAILGTIVLLSLPVLALPPPEPPAPRSPPPPLYGMAAVPRLLAGLVLLVLGTAVLAAALPELVYAARWWFLLLALVGVALQVAGWSAAFGIPTPGILARLRARTRLRLPRGVALGLSLALAAFLTFRVLLDPWATADLLGTVGTLALFLVVVGFLGSLAIWIEGRRAPPPFFRAFGLRRVPLFTLALVWLLLGGFLDQGGYHDVRLDSGAFEGTTVQQAWSDWLAKQDASRRAVPLIVVAAEGGGIRAAYWTASMLDCAMAGRGPGCGPSRAPGSRPSRSIFAASGISGGSLGIVEYAAHLTRPDDPPNWVDDRLGEDDLAPTWAWLMFKDVPNALLRLDVGMDRAEVLERAWEQSWGKRDASADALVPWRRGRRSGGPLAAGLSATEQRADEPLLLLNGTSVQDGCRINGSVLAADVQSEATSSSLRVRDCVSTRAFDAGGATPAERATWAFAATHDLADLLCPDQDLRLSTAALVSARFPYVTPSGRIPRCGTSFAVWTVDGGYFDTSAASPVVELWDKLEPYVEAHNRRGRPCVVPVFLQIDNHYTEPRGPKGRRTSELQAPLRAVRAAHDAREHDARQAAALAFQSDFGGLTAGIERYAHVFPRAHPGTNAPLGWALSQASMEDLKDQLASTANAPELARVRAWFSPNLRCRRAS